MGKQQKASHNFHTRPDEKMSRKGKWFRAWWLRSPLPMKSSWRQEEQNHSNKKRRQRDHKLSQEVE